MVRKYLKKRTKPEFSEEDMQIAIESVKEKDLSLRKAAEVFGVTHTALFYRLKKLVGNTAQKENTETFSSKIFKSKKNFSSNILYHVLE